LVSSLKEERGDIARALLWSVGLVYAVAWFVPVIKDGATLARGKLPGWEALYCALSPLWEFDLDARWPWETLSVLSGLTNLVFLLALVRPARRWSWCLFASAALNTFWFVHMVPIGDLRAGYWLWLASFVLLGLVSILSRGGQTDSVLPATAPPERSATP